MKTKADRDIEKLSPKFKEKVKLFLAEVNKNWKIIFVTEAIRSEERQKELIRAWLSQVKHSNHQDWLAIDIWFFWDELYPSDFAKWRKIADIGKKYQIEWGFDLWQWDKPHFQDNGKPIVTLINPIMKKTKYTDQMNNALKQANLEPIFDKHEWDKPLTEQETKELIEIAFIKDIARKLESNH